MRLSSGWCEQWMVCAVDGVSSGWCEQWVVCAVGGVSVLSCRQKVEHRLVRLLEGLREVFDGRQLECHLQIPTEV